MLPETEGKCVIVRETFDITGMTCAACEARVQRSASCVAGVTSANVNLLKNSMVLEYDGRPETVEAVETAIGSAGYGAVPRASRNGASDRASAIVDPRKGAQKAIREKRDQLVWSLALGVHSSTSPWVRC